MTQGHKWSVALKMDELWLNSDREILGRTAKEAGKKGILMTVELPNGEHFQAEVDRLNAETGSTYCQMAREYYNEWKAGKEAASRRKHRNREQQAALGGPTEQPLAELPSGEVTVQETVQALEESVQGSSTLEATVLHRLDAAYDTRSKLREQRERIERELKQLELELTQLEQMKEIFSASKVLEEAGESLSGTGTDTPQGVDDTARSTEAIATASEETKRGSAEE
jgi:vacuolar-type H+-ATPase subunit I/STV1